MHSPPLISDQHFRQHFGEQLKAVLKNQQLGAFILVLANALSHPDLQHMLTATLQRRFEQWQNYLQNTPGWRTDLFFVRGMLRLAASLLPPEIAALQCNHQAFNLLLRSGKVYLIRRKRQGEYANSDWSSGSFLVIGMVMTRLEKAFHTLDTYDINQELARLNS